MNTSYQYAVAPKLETDAFLMARATDGKNSASAREANMYSSKEPSLAKAISTPTLKDTLSVRLVVTNECIEA